MQKKRIRRLLIILISVLLAGSASAYVAYQAVFGSPLNIERNEGVPLFIDEEIDADSLRAILDGNGYLERPAAWDLTCRLMHFKGPVKPGHYLLDGGQSTVRLIRRFRSGLQDPVKVTFHGLRLRQDLAGRLASQLRLDSLSILGALDDDSFLAVYGLNRQTSVSIFIPNTYEIYWTTSVKGLFDRMEKEYRAFWNNDRRAKAEALNLDPLEVITLASIVQEETNKKDEMSTIAGVYVNRLKRGMRLEADPTARFARGDFDIRRVLDEDIRFESPYNTYNIDGLPPGPITIPEPYVTDAVLNYEHHDYLFMCAKADMSGYHAFARTNAQHEANAAAYHRALNSERTYR